MQTQNRLLDDLARVASGAMSTLGGLREEIEMRVRERFERFAGEMDLVTREEHEAVKAMAAKARAEQEDLAAKVAALEARLAALEGAGRGPARPAPKRKPRATRSTAGASPRGKAGDGDPPGGSGSPG
jgi:BMFP domain-containing protein YqiC